MLQIAVLQQNLLEKDVEEARKRKKTRNPEDIRPRPWLAEERRRRLYEHYARRMGELVVEDPQSLSYLRMTMKPAMCDELVQRVGLRIEKWLFVLILR